jgi:hypothetical protein
MKGDDQGSLNSSSSSMASFMSGLLHESSSRLELCPDDQPLVIDIVDDNARQQTNGFPIHQCRSLVTMQRSRSKQRGIARWSSGEFRREEFLQQKQQKPRMLSTSSSNILSQQSTSRRASKGSSGRYKARALKARTTSEDMLLSLPQRMESPGGRNNHHHSANAQWGSQQQKKKLASSTLLFDTILHLSPEETVKSMMSLAAPHLEQQEEQQTGAGPVVPSSSNQPNKNLAAEQVKNKLFNASWSVGMQMPTKECSIAPMKPMRRKSLEMDASAMKNRIRDPGAALGIQMPLRSSNEPTLGSFANTLGKSSGLSSSQSMTRIRDPAALGIQMPRRNKDQPTLVSSGSNSLAPKYSGLSSTSTKKSMVQNPRSSHMGYATQQY